MIRFATAGVVVGLLGCGGPHTLSTCSFIPTPRGLEPGRGAFTLETGTAIVVDTADAELVRLAGFWAEPGALRLTSDDGSVLRLGAEVVVDHDGLHGPSTAEGQVPLAAGAHPLRLDYFQPGGGKTLELEVVGWRGLSRPAAGDGSSGGGEWTQHLDNHRYRTA